MKVRSLSILGTRGIPAVHGGFETFAEHLSLHLVSRGWRVVIYCQTNGQGDIIKDYWNGIERVIIPVNISGSLGTIIFDFKSIIHAARSGFLCLTLGYNTAFFSLYLRLKNITNIINMDGIEWKRAKWSIHAKLWFWLNDWFGCFIANHLVADHPKIFDHLLTRVSINKISMIPYGAPFISAPDIDLIHLFNITKYKYLTVIARPEPENSIYEIVKGFSARSRGVKLVVLGDFLDCNSYHRKVKGIASDEVVFLGAIYDKSVVESLRFFSLAYIHGHQVGGTNPSLVEALGASNPILAHDNFFNHWVAGPHARFFSDSESFDFCLTDFLSNTSLQVIMRKASIDQYIGNFKWIDVLCSYENLLEEFS